MKRGALAALLALAGCGGGGGGDEPAARATVDAFHAALNSGDLAAIDALLAREARQLRPPMGTARAFRSIIARHGRHLATTGCDTGTAAGNGRDFITLACTSRFERATIAEAITLAEDAAGPRLFSYTYKVIGPA